MITNIRKIVDNLATKIVLGVFAVLFLVWSVVDSRPGRQKYVALIGNNNYIYKKDFIRYKKNLMNQMSKVYKQAAPDNTDINRMVIESLVQSELFKAESQDLKLLAGEELALERIRNMTIFQNKKGQFDKKIFENVLAINGISENDILDHIMQEISVDILKSIFVPYIPSADLMNQFFYYNNQKRMVDLVTIKPQPDFEKQDILDKDIVNYYSIHPELFTIPELRTVEYIVISSSKNDTRKTIEDDVAAGDQLKDIATRHRLKYGIVEKINKIGKSENSVKQIPEFTNFLKLAFSAEKNVPSEAVPVDTSLPDAGQYILNVSNIYHASKKPMNAELKKEISGLLKEEHKENIVREKAVKIYNLAVMQNLPLDQLAERNSEAVSLSKGLVITKPVSNAQMSYNIDTSLSESIFSIKNSNTYTKLVKTTGNNNSFQFAAVRKILLPDLPSNAQIQQLKPRISSYVTSAINQEFLSYLYKKHGVKVFPDSLKDL